MFSLLRCLFFLLTMTLPLAGWAQANDGFQRRDGAMFLIRNGEIRPMPQDIHLPNGRLITRDGFIVQRNGQRTELMDGQGCTLLGEAATVSRAANGRLQLANPAAVVPGSNRVTISPARYWSGWLRGRGKGHKKHKGRKH
ncbi:DUF6799 domain-containing protein [Hymenobacter sp. 102]|uniref:DUF6799 domain-containing protein n=1 Tax=Hymenobacter sp. 102 TaxID=3403152 RepID=UPI003CED2F34